MRIDVLTLFPEALEGFFGASIVRIAREKGLLDLRLVDFRRFAGNRWGKVDDRPYGGGPGMVLQCGPVYAALEEVLGRPVGPGKPPLAAEPGLRAVMLSPQGAPLTQARLEGLARAERLVLLCGHYEGFDERIRTGVGLEEISIGDYVLSGGEPAAMVVVDGVARLLEGVLGHAASTEEESFSRLGNTRGLRLEYPHYTRPPVYRGLGVPEVLLSGHHAEIARWRRERARERTEARRPDLLDRKLDDGSPSGTNAK